MDRATLRASRGGQSSAIGIFASWRACIASF
jgi:hypothetical protein